MSSGSAQSILNPVLPELAFSGQSIPMGMKFPFSAPWKVEGREELEAEGPQRKENSPDRPAGWEAGWAG